MKFNKIPNTDLNVSQICLGTMTWGSMQNTEQDGFEQMDYAVSKITKERTGTSGVRNL